MPYANESGGTSAPGQFIAYVGTYTTGESKGIYAFRYDAHSGETSPLGLAAATTNPSFLAIDRRWHFLYAVNEVDNFRGQASGAVSAFAIDSQSGKLTLLNTVPSRGADPCYIALDKTGKFVLVANYTGGSVAVFPVQSNGRLGESSAFVQHVSSGGGRRNEPHAHWIEGTFDNRHVVVADLGLNELLVYRFDAARGSLIANDPPVTAIDAGAGPRHVSFHPNGKFAYVVNELNSTVNALSFDSKGGVLHPLQTLSTLPEGFTGKNDSAELEIHPNGKFVYASNRGHNSIAVFAVDAHHGTLALVENVPTQGKTPRSFEIDPTGTRLFVANQDSDNSVVFRLNSRTGHLNATGEVLKVPSPVCIRFAMVESL